MKIRAKTFLKSFRQNAALNASSGRLLNSAVKEVSASLAAASSTGSSAVCQRREKDTVQIVHCPTCGRAAERRYVAKTSQVRTQCDSCDYLMVSCAKTGRVIESYAPSFSPSTFSARLAAS
ncbi:hypothetical protein S7335_3362 [Synechococcus sp. PCC 7335]|nr:hypothetical protein S7335_3362 [Synechococcus sp. PCC 7335]